MKVRVTPLKLKAWRLLIMPLMGFLLHTALYAEVRLPYILSDNMIIQRDVPISVWGWAKAGEKVTVTFAGQKVSAKTGSNGEWEVRLKPVAAGGPFEMTVSGSNTLVLKNILAGDVWICSGQSNMEWPLSQSRNWTVDKDSVDNPEIRLFYVPKNMSMKPLDNTLESKWEPCQESSASGFSAVGYYFGRELNRQLRVPIGLINSNWGGTDIETWISLERLYADPSFTATIDKMKSLNLEQLQKEAEEKSKAWQHAVDQEDAGVTGKWYLTETDMAGWGVMKLPQLWEGSGLPGLDGVVWFRKEFTVAPGDAGKEAVISLGPIDDSDECYVNGKLIGKTDNRYDLPRVYTLAPGMLREGKNVICIKVIDTGGGGGIWGLDEQLFVQAGGGKISLAGDWRYRVGLNLPAPGNPASPNSYPSLLYNAMINPLVRFPIRGAIWYQGENNASRYEQYRTLFPGMIQDWREQWNVGEFPFLFVQLANFMEPPLQPQQSSWAGLREAQTMALKVPRTGMAVIIDIGETKDIHPRNKDEVGYRLALNALKIAYGHDLVYSGPVFKGMEIIGDKIVLEFDPIGSGLLARDKYGYLKSFAIAGADKKFVWAKAYLAPGNKVVVMADTVKSPVAVRYAWSDNPDDANLYNAEGLPASPFRTDNW